MPWVGGVGWHPAWASLFKHLQSLQTRRLPAKPKTAPAPQFHTPTCHILKLPDTHFADTHAAEHTHTILYNLEERAHITPRHVAITWPAPFAVKTPIST